MSDEPRYDGWLPPRAAERPPSPAGLPAPRPAPRPAPVPARRGVPAPPRGRVDPLAVAALVSAAAGIGLLLLSLGLGFLLTLPLSIVGWRLGSLARRRIAVHEGAGGDGIARAGVVLGLAGVGLAFAAIVVWTILVLSGVSIAEFQEDLQREVERRQAS